MHARHTKLEWAFARRFLPLALCLPVLGGALLGCSKSGEADEVAVGAFLSLSGKESTFGIDTREGIDMATEDINAAGGIKGKKVRVIFEDDKSNAQEASNKVLQLIDRDKAIAILGEVASSRSKAGGLVANNKHIPMVTPSSTNVDVTQGREYVFRACFTDDQQGRSAASFAVEKLGKKKLAILYVAQDSYSSGLAASFRDAAQKLGAQIVADKGYQQGRDEFHDLSQ